MLKNKRIILGIIVIILILVLAVTFIIIKTNKKTIRNTCVVQFETSGGSKIEPQEIEKGLKVKRPDNPVKEGFTFVEWQLENAVYDFNTIVTEDLILSAYYTINEGTEIVLVSLDYQNGQEIENIEIIKGGTMAEPLIPQKQGYKFVGWYIDESKYDFSSKLNENITLIAKWEEDKTITSIIGNNKNQNDHINNGEIAGNNITNSKDESIKNENNTNYDALVDKYSGRWYLKGYADVCIDVSKYEYDEAMHIQTHNFSLSINDSSYKLLENVYLIYPSKHDNVTGWGSGTAISYKDWQKRLSDEKIVLGNNCIYINNNKFIKTKGEIDRYNGTCYKDALGVWYLENCPNSFIEIVTSYKGNIDNSDSFDIRTSHFSFEDFSTNSSTSSAGGGKADKKADWEKLGISVENNTLTIKNQNGVRKFYKTKTYEKVTGIFLDKTDVVLSIGKTQKIEATIVPSDAYDKELTWSSSNLAVATVSQEGVIIANGEGSAVISVVTKDGNYMASCKVSVSRIRVSGISLNRTSLNMISGDTQQLSATFTPYNAENKNVIWSSSDASIVQVSSNGTITAKNKGNAIITVKTEDGGYTASCNIVVSNPKFKVDGNIGISTIVTNDGVASGIKVTANPSGGTGNYTSYSIKLYYNGSLIGESSNSTLFVNQSANGTYSATITVTDSNGETATVTKTITKS